MLIDAQQREEIFDLRRPFGERVPVAAVHERDLRRVISAGKQIVGDIESHEHPVVWLYVPVRNGGKVTYVIAASLKTRVFQDLLMAYADGTDGGIVDADGDFVARRSTTPSASARRRRSTCAMRSAAAKAASTRGTTYEGLKNYTAYRRIDILRLVDAPCGRHGAASIRRRAGHSSQRASPRSARWRSADFSSCSCCATWRSGDAPRRCCVSRRRWKRSVSSPAASRTTSTIC